jgi:hypothetical protein
MEQKQESKVLTALLSYRLNGTSEVIEEKYSADQRTQLQDRVDSLRAIQAQDADGNFLANEYVQQNKVDYMVVSFIK